VILTVPFTKAKKCLFSFQSRFNAVINELFKDRGLEKLLVLFKQIPCMLCNLKFHLYVGNRPHTVHILQWQPAVQDVCNFLPPPMCTLTDSVHYLHEQQLRVSERRAMRRIFGPIKSQDGSWRIKTN